MLIQSIHDLERKVAVAELELSAIETAHHLEAPKLMELEDLASTIDDVLLTIGASPGNQLIAEKLRQLRIRMTTLLVRVMQVVH